MGCSDGYVSLPKSNAPERFSIQTGLICNLFGATHPLCKWVDEILPELPFSDVGKILASKLRTRIGNKITTKVLKEIGQNYQLLKKWQDKIKETNQLINDIWDTIQGGEISTLEFCLAGKPEFPEDINWADVFLAFSRLYPASLISKLEGIIAFQKYFEYCECRRVPQVFEVPETVENDIVSIPAPVFNTSTPCGIRFQYLWNVLGELGPTFNRMQGQFSNIEEWRKRSVLRAFQANIPLEFLISWELVPCEECAGQRKAILKDTNSGRSTVLFQPDAGGGYGFGCCEVTYQNYQRKYIETCVDVKYTYQGTSNIETIYLSQLTGIRPCDGSDVLGDMEYWRYPIQIQSYCDRFSEDYPDDWNFRDIKDIDPYNPCNTSYKPQFKNLCPKCPELTPQSTIVKIVRDCDVVFEPRSLYLP